MTNHIPYPNIRTILSELYRELLIESGERRISDNKVAIMVGVPPSSWNGYINGLYKPNFQNAILISKTLSQYMGRQKAIEFIEACGYSDMVELGMVVDIEDPDLQLVVKQWGSLDPTIKEKILQLLPQE